MSEGQIRHNLMDENVTEIRVIRLIYDYILWVGPIINRLPRDRKFTIGNRLLNHWYDLLELIIEAKYTQLDIRKNMLDQGNILLEKIRFLQRLLHDEHLWNTKRLNYAAEAVNEIGRNLGGWRKKI